MSIKKVAVIGSGVMGSGIAAQIANAGVDVLLYDIVPDNAADRNILAQQAIDKMVRAHPSPFMSEKNARLVTPLNLEDDPAQIATCDWVIEVVLEDLSIKQDIYKKIEAHRRPGTAVSSNTSTIPLQHLITGRSDDFAQHFMITHFFNPPRFMRLLELVTGARTDPETAQKIADFCDINLGKGIVRCNDTPGFIANRLGVFWITRGLNEAIDRAISVPLADAVLSRPAGIPKTGLFGLVDLVGIDLMPHLSESLLATLPEDDAYRAIYHDHDLLRAMIAAGYTGRKGKGGFYRLRTDENGQKIKECLNTGVKTFDPETSYTAVEKIEAQCLSAAKNGLRGLVESPDEGGQFAWAVLRDTLCYAASLVPEIADNIAAVDHAMRLGYNWQYGPFEMIDQMGAAWFTQKLRAEGKDVPPLLATLGDGEFYRIENGMRRYFGTDGHYHDLERPDGVLLLQDIKLRTKPVLGNASCAVWDIGDGVLCFEHLTKMNTFDVAIFAMLNEVAAFIESPDNPYKALVIYNEETIFSAGANLAKALELIAADRWDDLSFFIAEGQRSYMTLKYGHFPVICSPSGMALGGGCEVLLHADHVQAHAETYCGLVETGVGLIPAWGGCKEMILRYQAAENGENGPMAAVKKAFMLIAAATVAKSAEHAKELGYFRSTDGITMNRDRLLADAKKSALRLADHYVPPVPAQDIRLPGTSAKTALDLAAADMHKAGKATDYDLVVAGHLAAVLSGGEQADVTKPLSEQDLLDLERQEFFKLLRTQGTIDRINHMLKTGKPLRN